MIRDRAKEREILAHFESEQARSESRSESDEECPACAKIRVEGGYTSTLGVVHTYTKGCQHHNGS